MARVLLSVLPMKTIGGLKGLGGTVVLACFAASCGGEGSSGPEGDNEKEATLLSALKPIEADILRQRFGLVSEKELTLKEIGQKYNLSRERIRQLQEQALTKMRRALQRRDLL